MVKIENTIKPPSDIIPETTITPEVDCPFLDHSVQSLPPDVIIEKGCPFMSQTNLSLPPRTTIEQDRKSAGQRHINLVWETTQRNIALWVIGVATILASIVIITAMIRPSDNTEMQGLVIAAFTLLSNISFLVAGFYFGRTNHARIGDATERITSEMDTRQ